MATSADQRESPGSRRYRCSLCLMSFCRPPQWWRLSVAPDAASRGFVASSHDRPGTSPTLSRTQSARATDMATDASAPDGCHDRRHDRCDLECGRRSSPACQAVGACICVSVSISHSRRNRSTMGLSDGSMLEKHSGQIHSSRLGEQHRARAASKHGRLRRCSPLRLARDRGHGLRAAHATTSASSLRTSPRHRPSSARFPMGSDLAAALSVSRFT
jgi:hypothetical protein